VLAVFVNVMSEVLIVCMFVVNIMVLHSMFRFVFNVVEQLIILMFDRVLQGSTLVVGHVMAVDVTMVLAVFVNVMSEVLIV